MHHILKAENYLLYGRYNNDDVIGKPGYFLGNSHILAVDKKVIEADKSTSEKSYSSHLTNHSTPTTDVAGEKTPWTNLRIKSVLLHSYYSDLRKV